MAGSVGLAAYRAYSRRGGKQQIDTGISRPDGSLAWLHAGEPGNHLAIEDLATRLCRERDGTTVLVTLPDTATVEKARERATGDAPVIFQEAPAEHPDAVARFLHHWQPDLCLWAWGGLRPNLVLETAASGCPMVLYDVDLAGFDSARDRWLPEVSRRLLRCFSSILARAPAAKRRLESLGVLPEKIELTAALQPGGYALPCEDVELMDLRESLVGRPVWLAACLQKEEMETILQAHRHAMRLSHRLLLVIHPADACFTKALGANLDAEGLRWVDWNAGGNPEESTQVLIADDPLDLGLFYRVAPVSFLGSSLAAGFGGRNPYEAAALGSAVLYGPSVRRYLPFYTRLANAGAARIVKDAETLGTAVARLIAPDQAAAMACAGWDVISEGAAATDRLIELAENLLDSAESMTHASP